MFENISNMSVEMRQKNVSVSVIKILSSAFKKAGYGVRIFTFDEGDNSWCTLAVKLQPTVWSRESNVRLADEIELEFVSDKNEYKDLPRAFKSDNFDTWICL